MAVVDAIGAVAPPAPLAPAATAASSRSYNPLALPMPLSLKGLTMISREPTMERLAVAQAAAPHQPLLPC